MSARSKKSGSATRAFRNATIAGSFASQSGQEPLPAAVRIVLDDPGVALDGGAVGLAADAIGSVSESATCGFALMCSSLRLKRTDDVR